MSDPLKDKVGAQATALLRETLDEWWSYQCKRLESPIEKAFLVGFLALMRLYGESCIVCDNEEEMATVLRNNANNVITAILPQAVIGRYRVDFLFCHQIGPIKTISFIVECDGHDFHDRTKQQASRDRMRDRFLQANEFKVFRFTGSDIYADPFACAHELFDFMDGSKP